MSSANETAVKELYSAFQRGDIARILSGVDDDVDWNLPGPAPYAGIRHGREQLAQFFTELNNAVQIEQFDADEYVAAGDTVVVLGRSRATVRETGRPFESRWAHAFKLRGGRVVSAFLYEDTYAAASAFGESTRERQALTGPLGATPYSHGAGGREL